MGDEGPYRQAEGIACPQCATVLLARDGGEAACPRGCGEWVPQHLVVERWGPAITLDGDARLKWRVSTPPARCPRCKDRMQRVLHPTWQTQRCPTHGVWFVADARALFEEAFAGEIELHLAERRATEAITSFVRRAGAGDPAAIEQLVRRVMSLEEKVARLEAALNALLRGGSLS